MKTTALTHKILGAIWMAICAYFFANLVQAIYRVHPDRFDRLCIDLFFVLLFLTGAVAGFFLLIGARWARVAVSIVALVTVTASVLGIFAFFNSPPFPSSASRSTSSRSLLPVSYCFLESIPRPNKCAACVSGL